MKMGELLVYFFVISLIFKSGCGLENQSIVRITMSGQRQTRKDSC